MRLNNKIVILLICVLAVMSVPGCGSTGSTRNKEESAEIHMQLGIRYLNMDKLSFAKEHLEKAHDLDSDNAEVLNALAFLYEKLKQPEEARELYEDAIDAAPEDYSIQNNLGRLLCEQGEYESGLNYLKQAVSSPYNNRLWLALTNAGRCELMQDHRNAAEAYLRQALQLQAFYAPALSEMQKIAYENGDYWSAKGFLDRYLSVGPHTAETLWYAYQTERALGHREAAEDYRKTLLETFPLSKEAKKIISVQKHLRNGK